ncbi:phage recombination protein Bet [Photobacterium sp. R1]
MTPTVPFEERFPLVAKRGIDESTWSALKNSVYPGSQDDSVLMVIDYCKARELDPLQKPVHIVPMNVKDPQTGNNVWRDVVMPGIGLYRIQADRSGSYAGGTEPEFGPTISTEFKDKDGKPVPATYPEWCKITVFKVVNGLSVAFTAKEYWLENYATSGRYSQAPNAMWQKRPFAQLAKCAEAQALRKAWPEIGQQPTAEEMEGKDIHFERDITPTQPKPEKQLIADKPEYPAAHFEANFTQWAAAIEAGKMNAEQLITKIESKGTLTDGQKAAIRNIDQGEAA